MADEIKKDLTAGTVASPNTEYYYENGDIQNVLEAYANGLTRSDFNDALSTGDRLKKVGDKELFLMPANCTDYDNLTKGYDFANNARFQDFGGEIKVQDNLTPRLEEFKNIVKEFEKIIDDPTIKNSGEKISFAVPIKQDKKAHWYGAVISCDTTQKPAKFTYVFLDSLSKSPKPGFDPSIPETEEDFQDHLKAIDIQTKIENTFEGITQDNNIRVFYHQDNVSCGACLSANIADNFLVPSKKTTEPTKIFEKVDIDLRQKHLQMALDPNYIDTQKTTSLEEPSPPPIAPVIAEPQNPISSLPETKQDTSNKSPTEKISFLKKAINFVSNIMQKMSSIFTKDQKEPSTIATSQTPTKDAGSDTKSTSKGTQITRPTIPYSQQVGTKEQRDANNRGSSRSR